MDREGVRRVHVELTWRDQEIVEYSTAGRQIRTVNRGGDQRQKMTDGGPGVRRAGVKKRAALTNDDRWIGEWRSDG